MSSYNEKLKKFSVDLFKVDAIQFGDFKMKLGLWTPIYCDIRRLVSYPKIFDELSDLLVEHIKTLKSVDVICGVPYTALPIASLVSVKSGIPMVMRRKEPKGYGLNKLIEGCFTPGSRCLIIEDVATSGSSILETAKDLNDAGLKCTEAIVVLNREQGADVILAKHGITMYGLLTMSAMMKYLRESVCIDDKVVEKVTNYIKTSQIDISVLETNGKINRLKLSYEQRGAEYAKNPVAKKLFKIISDKQTNLCLAADVTKSADLIKLAKEAGPHICLLKTHIDIIEDFSEDLIETLKSLAKLLNFILFEDRKFADIGKTVQSQYSNGIYRISSWAELVTAHSMMGKGLLDAIKESPGLGERGVFILAQSSSAGSLMDEKYTKATLKLAKDNSHLIMGVVCQDPLFMDSPGILQLTPGVQIGSSGDNLGQQYNSPENVIVERGADIAVVGRGITLAENPGIVAEKYKELLWNAYTRRIQ